MATDPDFDREAESTAAVRVLKALVSGALAGRESEDAR
jgi:hypothetical protein